MHPPDKKLNYSFVDASNVYRPPPPQNKVGAKKYFANSLQNLCNIVFGEGGGETSTPPKMKLSFLPG